MRSTIRRRKFRAKRGLSEMIGILFLILIIFVAFTAFEVMFNSYVSYQRTDNAVEQQQVQNQQTLLSSSMQFGSPIVSSGSSNPPAFNLNSIGTSTVGTYYTFENKIVYAQNLWWAIYSSGSAIVYQTSADGITWSATATLTAATGSTVDYGFADWLGSGPTLYFVLATSHAGTNSFTLGKVALNAGGTIGSVTTATITLGANYDSGGYASITGDTSSSGYIWVALNVYHSTGAADTYVQVERCTTTLACTAMDGTAPPTITLASVVTNDLIPMVDDLSGGSMAVLYANSGGTGQAFALEAFNIQTCTGGTGAGQCQVAGTPTWSARVTTASTFYPEHSSSVSIGTTVYFAGANSTAEGTWSFPLGGAAPKTYQIDATVNGATAPADVAEDGTGNVLGTGNTLAVFYGSGTTMYYATSTTDTSWTRQTVSTSENTLIGINTLENSTDPGAYWTSGAASPFTIRFAEVNTFAYNPTQIAPSTVDTSITQTATSSSGDDRLFFDLGLWWNFFAMGTGIDYATSSDGLVWSAATSVITSATYSGAATGSDFSVALSGNTVYWALSSGDSAASFDYNSGTLSSSGTIAFGTTATITTAATSTGPISIDLDVSGNAWVALTTLVSTTYHIEVYEHASGAANTAWSANIAPTGVASLTAGAYPIITGLDTAAGAALVAETGTVTSETGAVSVYSTTVTSSWTTSTWTTAVATTSDYELASSSDTLIGNTLAFSGLASGSTGATTGTLKFWTFSVGVTTTAPTEQTIESSTAAWQSAIGSEGTTIFLFDASVSTINYYYSANLGYTWSSKFVATVYEPSITGLSGAGAGTMAVTWTNGNPSVGTFNVRFASLSSLAVTNNSGFAVHAVSLFITQPSTNTLLSYYEINSSELFDYWLGAGSTAYLATTFPWTTTTAYQFTIGTSTGVLFAVPATSPA